MATQGSRKIVRTISRLFTRPQVRRPRKKRPDRRIWNCLVAAFVPRFHIPHPARIDKLPKAGAESMERCRQREAERARRRAGARYAALDAVPGRRTRWYLRGMNRS
jgi:hypothetical protein